MMVLASSLPANLQAEAAKGVLANTMKSLEGEPVELAKYEGKVVLFVNVASKCGYTNQYTGLQELHDKYKDKGLAVVGVPCNQFGGQEPGSNKEIQEFCSSKYKVTFDMLDKVDVKGDKASPLYQQLTAVDTKPKGKGDVSWNFEKFLVNKKGEVIGRYASAVKPDSPELIKALEAALAE